ncbi:MAG: 2-oxoacid:acceptor oxidoreductase family protein [Eubacteriales bacterium]|nr:2-oxoacid:acceptor oxidoreductase family protein [Eubacteriales bacterium]
MQQQLVISGFGGQGVMSLGQVLAYAGMMADKQVSWLPSYGPEMRGGAAYCHVILSDEAVGSPIITQADTLIAMNGPSLDAFESMVAPGGHLLINSSLIARKSARTDVDVHYVPANDIANELGNVRVAGMVVLGAYIELTRIVDLDTLVDALRQVLGEKKEKLIPVNRAAMQRGMELVRGETD